MKLTIARAKEWMLTFNQRIQEEKDHLTELDQAIGDGDHGLNMARGFQEVVKKIEPTNYDTLDALFKDVAMTLISKVGGASGPLYGTAFLRLSTALKAESEANREKFVEGLKAALDGIKARGKAHRGDKTMVDVWEPVVDYVQSQSTIHLSQLNELAKEKMEETKDLEAKMGRASYLGKRSIGTIDPGAASSYLLFASLADCFQKGEMD
ncbi:dihydroxyacetone kinase subunit DhaL [Fervidibacillus halotolerans]|uniref:phosphoenolpyruvate--glycerone phosphotransferase n=1 Tax=Fervidibacillus halotolerans TaxID=2980027 RepID=A0A9E8RZR1_9BACI|nr:dihydroxyacetone kinase subunit DhaL [Fervidibacillus halotolerans]WAA13409.1 dihydroxyacetone kinase subunit DhaL [Fervidibacillus halotolerans]